MAVHIQSPNRINTVKRRLLCKEIKDLAFGIPEMNISIIRSTVWSLCEFCVSLESIL
jgi:hypothetical protein